MTKRSLVVVLLGALVLGTPACASQQKPEPAIASSAGEFGYAARFPTELGAARGRLSSHENNVQLVTAKFANYPAELNEPDWDRVAEVVRRADQAGRSAAYVGRARESIVVAGFFEEEKEEIGKKVGGAAQYAASQKGCKDTGAYGAATHALEKSVEKQLQERLRAHNEAHLYIEDNQERLGKKNLDALRDQADEVSYASYLVHIAAVEEKVRMRDALAQADEVRGTLDDEIKEAQAVIGNAESTEEDKAAAQAHLDTAQKAKETLESEVKQAQHVLEGVEERIKKMQEQYEQALQGLLDAIEQKKKEAESQGEAKS